MHHVVLGFNARVRGFAWLAGGALLCFGIGRFPWLVVRDSGMFRHCGIAAGLERLSTSDDIDGFPEYSQLVKTEMSVRWCRS